MRQGGLGQVEHAENVGAEGAFELLGGDVGEVFLWVLLGGVVDEDVELAEFLHCLRHSVLTELGIADVSGHHQAPAALGQHHFQGVLRVLVLVEVQNRHVGPFTGKMHRHGASDAAVAAADEGHLALEFVAAPVVVADDHRRQAHFGFAAGLLLLGFGGHLLRHVRGGGGFGLGVGLLGLVVVGHEVSCCPVCRS